MKARAQAKSTSLAAKYPRDMVGYGKHLPDPKWPGRARLALQISLNYEAGGELNMLHGDRVSEAMLTDIGFPAVAMEHVELSAGLVVERDLECEARSPGPLRIR